VEGAEYAGIEANHTEMCKFDTKNSPGYDIVAEAIQRYSSKEVVARIKNRWQEDRKRLREDVAFEANELVEPYSEWHTPGEFLKSLLI
jgi:protein SERAC1